ncbi:MAG: mitochondrial fission ELM1 family protein [Paracoccaceae bacterium]
MAQTTWIVTTGEAGMRAQACGLAARIGLPFDEKTVTLRPPWSWLPGHVAAAGMRTRDAGARHIPPPPWPDLLIACGRRSIPAALLIRRAGEGRTFTVYLQDPKIPPRYFDLVIPMQHDGLRGGLRAPNVHPTLTALHGLTPDGLVAAADALAPTLKALPRPLVAVLIGGKSRAYDLSETRCRDIAGRLLALVKSTNCGMIVTLSRRSGAQNAEILRATLRHQNIHLWSGQGDNPYPGMLGAADHIIATGDTVSMISEASATGKPVSVIDLDGGSARFSRFHANMTKAGITRPFDGNLAGWSYETVDETGRIAALVRQHLNRAG